MNQLLGYRIYQTNTFVPVRWIEEKLKRIMNAQIKPDDKLENDTIELIQRFQESRNLSPDGQIGPLTLKALMDADSDTDRFQYWKNKLQIQPIVYRIYQTNEVVPVQWIKPTLNRIMNNTYIYIDDDNYFLDDYTKELIRRFQESRNLSPDGKIGPLTLKALRDADPWNNIKVEIPQESVSEKIIATINNIIDALDDTFYDNKGLVGLSFFAAGDSVKDVRVGSKERHYLNKLYKKVLSEKDFFKKKLKTLPESYVNLNRELNKTTNPTQRLQIKNQMGTIRVNHIKEVSTAIKKPTQIAEIIKKVKNVRTTLNKVLSKVMAFLKPLGKIFKVIEWSSVAVYVAKTCRYFYEGKLNDGFEYLCKSLSKTLEIAIGMIATGAAVAGTVALCATAGLGATATAIAALAATIAVAIIIFFISYFWNQYVEDYFDNL